MGIWVALLCERFGARLGKTMDFVRLNQAHPELYPGIHDLVRASATHTKRQLLLYRIPPLP